METGDFDKNIPCKNCVTLSICKQMLNIHHFDKYDVLIKKCSLIKDYLGAENEDFYGVPMIIYKNLRVKNEKELDEILGWKKR